MLGRPHEKFKCLSYRIRDKSKAVNSQNVPTKFHDSMIVGTGKEFCSMCLFKLLLLLPI